MGLMWSDSVVATANLPVCLDARKSLRCLCGVTTCAQGCCRSLLASLGCGSIYWNTGSNHDITNGLTASIFISKLLGFIVVWFRSHESMVSLGRSLPISVCCWLLFLMIVVGLVFAGVLLCCLFSYHFYMCCWSRNLTKSAVTRKKKLNLQF